MGDKEEKVEKKAEVKVKKTILSPELIATKQRAHELKVTKFLAGGKF